MQLKNALLLFEESLIGEVKERTRRWYISFDNFGHAHGMLASLLHHFDDVLVEQITVTELRRWRKAMYERKTKYGGHRPEENKGLRPATKNSHLRAVKRFFNWLETERHITINPARRLKYEAIGSYEPKAVALEDFKQLLRAIGRHSRKPIRDLAITLFLFDTGCRVGGLCGLKMSDLDLKNQTAYVYEKGRGANGQGRWVFLEPPTAVVLSAYLEQRPDDLSTVFGVTENGVNQMLRRRKVDGKITGPINPHSFRHGAARNWLVNGGSLPLVSQLLGHKDTLVTSMFYARWQGSELQQLKKEIAPLNDGSLHKFVNQVIAVHLHHD